MSDSGKQREFAFEVVRRLRDAGFEAYWAGGCVRDQFLGRTPKDYDVATNAKPPEIRNLFGHRRTLAIGAAFGVITVLGHDRGQIEVATFRRDAAYSDGRHPDAIAFSSAEEDASRRDFTINGLFYDPIEEQVIDFVGGRDDLDRRVIRAIGDPRERIAEDKLRMLRAVRFSAAFDFEVEAATLTAVCEMAPQITVVSPERIAMEMRRMLAEPGRVRAVRLFVETGLAAVILPEIAPDDEERRERFERTLTVLDRLEAPGFPLALATLLHEFVDADIVEQIGRRWRLSNKEIDRSCWLVQDHAALVDAPSMPWSALQPILIAEGIDDLLALHEAISPAADAVAHCRSLLQQPGDALNPAPLLTGDDLRDHGVPPGPKYRELLERIRIAQLDGKIHTKQEALAMADRLRKT